MTKNQLVEVMIFHLTNFSGGNASATKDTVHSDVLSDEDGIGTATSKRIYRSFIRYTMISNGSEDNPWPSNWIDLTVEMLATKLLEI